MIELLLILTAIALLDSLSMIPLAVVPLTVAMGGSRPWSLSLSFVAGVFLAYLLCGIPLLLGAEVFIDHFGAYLNRLWNRPNAVELGVQILIGILLIPSAWYLWRKKNTTSQAEGAAPSATAGALFFLGATLVVVGMPGAVPYLAAIERIVAFDSVWMLSLGSLLFYNVVFVVPLLALVGLRVILGSRADGWLQALTQFCLRIMPRVAAVLFLLLGLVLIADGVGWFCGYPLLPVKP